MSYENFKEWLISNKSMGIRSAKDVISRCKRIQRILNTDGFDLSTLELLVKSDEYVNSSTFIRAQLKRAVTLALEYQEEIDE